MPSTNSDQPQSIGVAILLFDRSQRLLLGKRKNSYKAGMWGVPGGRVEKGELLTETAARELQEETGIRSHAFTFVGVVKEQQEAGHFIHFIFRCEEWEGTVITREPEKCEGWGWFEIDSFPKPLLPGHQAAFELWQTEKTLIEL